MLGVDVATAARLLRKKQTDGNTVSKSVKLLGLDRQEFYIRLARNAKIKEFVSPNPRVLGMMKQLRAKGIKVALHTNSGKELAKKTLGALGIGRDCYDLLVTSDDTEPKPSPAGYRFILHAMGAKPAEAVYVGDRFEVEIEPAKRIGMRTVLVGKANRANQVDYVVARPEKVEEILRME
jgi:HAD superfamily hydrolase (TIGR01509 family)